MRHACRMMAAAAMAALGAAAAAQTLSLGTMEGTMRYAPVVAASLKESGYEVKARGFSTQAALLEALGKGEIDGGFFLPQPVIATVRGAVMVPVKLGETRFDAVTLDPKIKINSPGDLRNYKVGIVKDHSGHMALTRGMAVTTAASDMEEFKLLVDGKVQVIIVLEEILHVMAKPAGLKDYHASLPLLRTPNFLALSAAKAGEAQKAEAALKKWVGSGRWDEEMAKLDAPPPKQ